MHLVNIKFDRVFDIVQDPMKKHSYATLFSFESNGRRFFSVSIAGKPRLENGMEVIAALGRRDDWKSLEGWKDVQTGQIYLPKLPSLITPVFRAAPLILTGTVAFRHSGSLFYLAGAVLLSLLCLIPVFEVISLRKARKALEGA